MKTSRLHSSANDSTPSDPSLTLIRIAEVMAIVGLARPTIYKLMNEPESGFPKTVKLTNSKARGAPVAWVCGRSSLSARTSGLQPDRLTRSQWGEFSGSSLKPPPYTGYQTRRFPLAKISAGMSVFYYLPSMKLKP